MHCVYTCISLVPRRSEGRGEITPGTHCLRMRLISEISRKIGYFSNPPCNDDVEATPCALIIVSRSSVPIGIFNEC